MRGMDIFIKSPRGAFDIFDLFGQILDLFEKLWTFQYAAGVRGAGVLIKRSTIVALSVRPVAQRSRYLTIHKKKV